MNKLSRMALDRVLEYNQRLSHMAVNGTAWVFKRDTLIKSGRTWFELVHDSDLMAVRYYGLPEEDEIELNDGSTMRIQRKQHDIPLVLILPLGVTSDAFDLMPQSSLVRFMAASGFKTYLVDWGKPGKRHSSLGLEDYSQRMMHIALEKIRKHSGSKELSMMGWCLGGLFCLLHQGQVQDPNIRNIITVASPIDLEAGSGLIGAVVGMAQALNAPAQLVGNAIKLRSNLIDTSQLNVPPRLTTFLFKMTDPLSSVTAYWDLVTNLWDREFVESHATSSNYLNNMLMYPGGVIIDAATTTLSGNHFGSGRVEFGDTVADFTAIKSNLLAFGGQTDSLVPIDVCRKIVELVASKDKEFREAPGGHMGVILGSKAQKTVWAQSAEWLAERSSAKPPRKPAKKKADKVAPRKARKAKSL